MCDASNFAASLPHSLLPDFFWYSHPIKYEIASYSGFDFHFPNNKWCWASSCPLISCLFVFFEMSLHMFFCLTAVILVLYLRSCSLLKGFTLIVLCGFYNFGSGGVGERRGCLCPVILGFSKWLLPPILWYLRSVNVPGGPLWSGWVPLSLLGFEALVAAPPPTWKIAVSGELLGECHSFCYRKW